MQMPIEYKPKLINYFNINKLIGLILETIKYKQRLINLNNNIIVN